MTRPMSAEQWDARYRQRELVWCAVPNMWVERETAGLAPGRALHLACGEGRNSVWLAAQGWTVTGLDFSSETIAKAWALAASQLGRDDAVDFCCADITHTALDTRFDLVLLVYLQLPELERRAAWSAAWAALAPGGTLLVIAHDSDNLARGVGGPQDPAVLYTADDVRATVTALAPDAQIEICDAVARPVEASQTPAIDALFRARKPV